MFFNTRNKKHLSLRAAAYSLAWLQAVNPQWHLARLGVGGRMSRVWCAYLVLHSACVWLAEPALNPAALAHSGLCQAPVCGERTDKQHLCSPGIHVNKNEVSRRMPQTPKYRESGNLGHQNYHYSTECYFRNVQQWLKEQRADADAWWRGSIRTLGLLLLYIKANIVSATFLKRSHRCAEYISTCVGAQTPFHWRRFQDKYF